MYPRLTRNSRSFYLSLPSAGVIGLCCYDWPEILILVIKTLSHCYFFVYLFEVGSYCVAQAALKLMILLPNGAGITGMYHHTQPRLSLASCFWTN
jgi:hypothetical protein